MYEESAHNILIGLLIFISISGLLFSLLGLPSLFDDNNDKCSHTTHAIISRLVGSLAYLFFVVGLAIFMALIITYHMRKIIIFPVIPLIITLLIIYLIVNVYVLISGSYCLITSYFQNKSIYYCNNIEPYIRLSSILLFYFIFIVVAAYYTIFLNHQQK